MDIKKSPKADLESNRLTYVLLGFVFVLAVLYVGFEWTDKEITVYEVEESLVNEAEEEMTEITFQEETPPPPPPPAEVPQVIEVITIVDDNTEVAEVDFSSEDDETQAQEVILPPAPPVEEEPEVEEIFLIVEKQPEFPGGHAALMKYFNDNVRYPVIAAENGIQGRVVCQFTVWKDGSVSEVKVIRSANELLDKEAIRVVESMPKWTPGKNKGEPVNVRYVLPVSFKLNKPK